MGVFSTISDVVLCLYEPWAFMLFSVGYIPQTVSQLVTARSFGTFFSPFAFSDALFGNLWVDMGPMAKEGGEPKVIPLLEGRVSAGEVREDQVNPPVRGVVVEVGAGSGMWADVLARIRDSHGKITKIYGIEPNPTSAAALRKRVKEVGLEDVYEVVPVGIESVDDPTAWNGKIEPGSVDCIVGIRCLCSIPEPQKNIALLYRLLKPGGSWYVYEHVKARHWFPVLPLYQRFANCAWMFFMGSCRLCRSTDKWLREAGPWKSFDLQLQQGEPSYAVLPHVVGVLTK